MELAVLAVIFFIVIGSLWKKIAKFDREMENIYKDELKKRNK